ncbi:MAG: uncharacterized protein QOG33_2632 [Gaiellales bacterium]|nr:uncharacterized protein [Gaiellales bacterium]
MSVGAEALRSEGASTARVLITAKAPLAGRAKTRLSPPLPIELAARLAEAFLADVLSAARAVDAEAGFLCPASDAADLRRRFAGVPLVVQTGHGLSGALASGVRAGTVVVAGDAPGIRPEAIAAAATADADVVLAPSRDGGFTLIRMRRHHPAVFDGIHWSTGSVLNQVLATSRAAGLSVELLDPVADVDTVDDLAGLDLSHAHATRAVLCDPTVLWPLPPTAAG